MPTENQNAHDGQAGAFGDGPEFEVKVASDDDAPQNAEPHVPEGTQTISDETFVTNDTGSEKNGSEESAIDDVIYELAPNSKVKDYRDGQVKEFAQIANEENLRQKLDQRWTKEIQPQVEYVKQNKRFIDAADKSIAAKVMLTALANNATEEEALAAGLAAAGKSLPQSQPAQDQDPEPKLAPGVERDSPEYSQWALDHFKWETRQDAKKELAPLMQEIQSLKTQLTQRDASESAAKIAQRENYEANQSVYRDALYALVPAYDSLPDAQREAFNKALDKISAENDVNIYERQYTTLEMRGLVREAMSSLAPPPKEPVAAKPKAPPLRPGAPAGSPIRQSPRSNGDPLSAFKTLEGAKWE